MTLPRATLRGPWWKRWWPWLLARPSKSSEVLRAKETKKADDKGTDVLVVQTEYTIARPDSDALRQENQLSEAFASGVRDVSEGIDKLHTKVALLEKENASLRAELGKSDS